MPKKTIKVLEFLEGFGGYDKSTTMKKQINNLLLKMQSGENCIGDTANKLLSLFESGADPAAEDVNSPARYNKFSVEVIDMMERVFGKEKTAAFCELNAFKYQMGVGFKDCVDTDLAERDWYLDKVKELKECNSKAFLKTYMEGLHDGMLQAVKDEKTGDYVIAEGSLDNSDDLKESAGQLMSSGDELFGFAPLSGDPVVGWLNRNPVIVKWDKERGDWAVCSELGGITGNYLKSITRVSPLPIKGTWIEEL